MSLLKKSSSILQELGLGAPRAEARAAARAQKALSLQEAAPPCQDEQKENICKAPAAELKKEVPATTAAAGKVHPTTETAPTTTEKARPECVASAPSVAVVATRQPALGAPALGAPALGAPSAPALGVRELSRSGPLIASEPSKGGALKTSCGTSIGAQPPPIQKPQPAQKSASASLPPPKPSGIAVPAVSSTVSAAPQAPELAGLRWPKGFLVEPKAARVEFSEDTGRATRESGVGRGFCFLGPLQLDKVGGSAYFEVEILELEAQRSQTMALGFVSSLPAARPLLAERATELGSGSFLIGYDLPKLYINGEAANKISGWRPLKELCRGDRVGLLLQQQNGAPEFTIYVNGVRKVNVPLPCTAEALGSELYGVVDIHGAVRSVRLRRPPNGPLTNGPLLSRPLTLAPPLPKQGNALAGPAKGIARGLEESAEEAAICAVKRARLSTFPDCKCSVHLVRQDGGIVHVTSSDFCIGRDTKVANLTLDCTACPNMVSRKHARIETSESGIHVIDHGSLNGTWLNGAKVIKHLLKSGDKLVIGNPKQGPADFKFSVALP